MIGTTAYDHFPREEADRLIAEDAKIMETGENLLNSQEKKENPDGSVSWFLMSKVSLLDEEGQCIGLVGI